MVDDRQSLNGCKNNRLSLLPELPTVRAADTSCASCAQCALDSRFRLSRSRIAETSSKSRDGCLRE